MNQQSAIEIVKKYIDFLKEIKIAIKKAYIFGLFARGTHTQDSDIDLALILNNISNQFTMQVELMKLGRKIDTRIEPHPIDEEDFNESNPFANEVIRTGIEIE